MRTLNKEGCLSEASFNFKTGNVEGAVQKLIFVVVKKSLQEE